jgi:choline kinase
LKKNTQKNEPVSTALLLAAGTGSRLYPLTKNEPKCMTIVNGRSILERMVSSLKRQGFKRLVIVTGHLEHCIRDFLGDQSGELFIEYIFSPLYKTTNNIYSLWMARKIIREPFLLLESDLVFDDSLLSEMIYPDRIAVAAMQPWMNGSCVTIDHSAMVDTFEMGDHEVSVQDRYKTVNIYSFSLESWKKIIKNLDKQISSGNVNSYYEIVFAEMVSDNNLSFQSVSFDSKPWYEIDTLEDLVLAEKIIPSQPHKTGKTSYQPKQIPHYQKLIHTSSTPKVAERGLHASK